MQRAMIRWRVKPTELDTKLHLLAEMYAEMQELRPADLKYDTYRLDDGLSYIASPRGRTAWASSARSRPSIATAER